MAKRRADRRPLPQQAPPELMPPSARVAWAYLAGLLALVGAGLLVVLANQVFPALVCPAGPDLAEANLSCRLGLVIWSGIGGFLLCLVPAVLLLKLDWWLWVALAAGAGLMLAADAVDQWWWWTLAAAQPELIRFILSCHASGRRLVLVITGKGSRGDVGPLPTRPGALRHQVPYWLHAMPLSSVVQQVTAAHYRHGGEGAYYVYLRRNG